MKIIRTVKEMQLFSRRARTQRLEIGFVPTMGALHDGHVALATRSKAECDLTVVSIFVNPLQFGPKEDFRRYPRTEKADIAMLQKAGVDVAFIPTVTEIFPQGFQTQVRVGALASRWEGAARPGHFDGVATIVAKLFGAVGPDRAYFGQKDFQQLRVIERMTADLSLPIQIVRCETVREADGLARSSRNRYLSPREREEAVKLYQALYLGRELIEQRVMMDASRLSRRLGQVLTTIPKAKVDYIAVADPETLEPQTKIHRPVLLALAVRIGKTRLIDNIVIA